MFGKCGRPRTGKRHIVPEIERDGTALSATGGDDESSGSRSIRAAAVSFHNIIDCFRNEVPFAEQYPLHNWNEGELLRNSDPKILSKTYPFHWTERLRVPNFLIFFHLTFFKNITWIPEFNLTKGFRSPSTDLKDLQRVFHTLLDESLWNRCNRSSSVVVYCWRCRNKCVPTSGWHQHNQSSTIANWSTLQLPSKLRPQSANSLLT